MSTIVGIEAADGALLAGDRVHVEGETRVSDGVRRVFEFEAAGAAVVGEPGAIDEFSRRLGAETRDYRIEHDEPMGIDRLARSAAEIADAVDVRGIVTARDDEGVPRIRTVDGDGAVLSESPAALGSGAQLAIGQLDAIDAETGLGALEDRVRDLFESLSDRDAGTGAEIDVRTLEPDR